MFIVSRVFISDALVVAVQLLPEGNDKLINADVSSDPFPDLLEDL
jgi:hypothetical protein